MNPLENIRLLASAGTGKTFRLTNRFLGLLLAGVEPARILATTFTQASGDDDLQRRATAYGNHLQCHVDQSSVPGAVDGFFAQPSQEEIVGEQNKKLQHGAHRNGNGHAEQIGITGLQLACLIHGGKSLHS